MSDTGIRQYGRTNLPGANSSVRIQAQDVAIGALHWRMMNFRHVYIAPTHQPMAQLKGSTGAVPSGATGSVNILHFYGQGIMEEHIKGAGQTLIVPTILADGLEMAHDLTSTEGFELCCGLTGRSPGVFVNGTDPAYFMRVRMVIDDVSGTDTLALGFRINQAYQTALASYTDFAVLNLNAGQWETKTRLNSGTVTTTTLTGSTVADLGNFEVQLNVTAAGAVTYELGSVTAGVSNRAPVTLAPAFTFDSGDVITGFILMIHTADVVDSLRLRQFEAGFQSNIIT